MAAPQARTEDGRRYFEQLLRAIFQAGLGWPTIESHWPAFGRVFYDFDPVKVAEMKRKTSTTTPPRSLGSSATNERSRPPSRQPPPRMRSSPSTAPLTFT
jgi:Methyladenine glycosylase